MDCPVTFYSFKLSYTEQSHKNLERSLGIFLNKFLGIPWQSGITNCPNFYSGWHGFELWSEN